MHLRTAKRNRSLETVSLAGIIYPLGSLSATFKLHTDAMIRYTDAEQQAKWNLRSSMKIA
jgi:hypothetical protein